MTNIPENIALRYIQRRVLLLSLIPLGILFTITATLARTYHAREAVLAREWLQRGSEASATGKHFVASDDFRNALSFDPENNVIQLRLAEALLAAGRLSEANSYFLNLWDRNPGSGEVNLNLARISAQMGDVEDAARRYRGAIYGSWESEPARRRRNARLELCELLLDNGRTGDAAEELAGLSADAPRGEPNLHEQIGQLFLKAGIPARAVEEFEAALQTDPNQAQWLEDAGKSAYEAGDYQKAETYLAKADRESPSNQFSELLATVRDVLRGDPYLSGLSDEEQTQRSWHAFEQALDRLHSCAARGAAERTSEQSDEVGTLLKSAKDLKDRVNLQSLAIQPELRNEAMRFIFHAEDVTSRSCGNPSGLDLALVMIGKKHEGGER